MKKKGIIAVVVVAAVAGSLFIAPVRAFAVDAMGVFRVSDPNVINISTQDLNEITQNVQTLKSSRDKTGESDDQTENGAQSQNADTLKQYETVLNSAADFKAFSFNLPTYLSDQTPVIKQIDLPPKTVTINTVSMNKTLAGMQSPVTVPDNLEGRKMTIMSSPMVAAEYQDAICFAAQKPSFNLPGNMDSIVTQAVTTLPLLTDDIRSQLGNINLFDKNIYLPNVEGVTKTADLGRSTGYIYAVNDIAALGDNLLATLQPSGQDQSSAGESLTQKLQKYAGDEAILWVNHGTLYGVFGKYTDDQLAAIAKTMQ